MNEAEEQRRFDDEGNNWEAWRWKAESLLAGAACIRQQARFLDAPNTELGAFPSAEEVALHMPLLLLRAFELECLFKARWLHLGNRLYEGGAYKGREDINRHDLVGLARAVALELDGEEEDVLRRISVYGTGYGRYPAPRLFASTRPQLEHDGITRPAAYWGHDCEAPFLSVLSRLFAALGVRK